MVSALHNGRGEAALFLAEHGAHLDLEGAAGTGRVDVVAQFVEEQARLRSGATKAQLDNGFVWACEYGRANVVAFLLQRGFKPDSEAIQGGTGLHWAALGGYVEIVDLLLKTNLPVNQKDKSHSGTPLGWALYGWDDSPKYYEVVAHLIRAGATIDWPWIGSANRGSSLAAKIRADSRMMAALQPT